MAYWRLEEMSMPVAHDMTGRYNAHFEEGVALHLPGADERIGHQAPIPPARNAFSFRPNQSLRTFCWRTFERQTASEK